MDPRGADARFPACRHSHGIAQDTARALQLRYAAPDQAEAADLVRGRHGAALPRMGLALPAIVDEAQALAFEILEIEREPTVTLDDLIAAHVQAVEAVLPPLQGLLAVHTQ